MPATKPRAYQVYDIDWKQAVRALSDSNINLASPGALVIDAVVLNPYDRVLLTAQTDATENGIYQVNAAQTLLVPAPDWVNINSGLSSAVNSGLTVSVTAGAEYAQTTWTLTTPNPIVIGTTTINFARTPDQISNVAIDGTTIELANNASETSISIRPSGTGGLVGITVPNDATANVANLHIYNLVANGNVKISTDGGDWLYDTQGDFTGAGNISAGYFVGNGSQLTGISALGSFIANGTSTVDIGAIDGNVVVTTDGANAWTFDTAGNLTMPGSLVAETAGNTGSLRWEINGSNLNVLKLIPDDNLVPEDRYVVIDPYNTGHIHIRAGGIQDASNSYLYLGGEDVHVEVDDFTKEIRVKTYSVVGVSSYQFSFANDGHFQSPNGIITGGNLSVSGNAQAQYFIGNGALLTGISAGSSYSNANVVAYAELGWAGNIIPSANAVYSLGNATNQWGNLWVANNTIYLGNVPLAIGAGNVLTVDGNAVLQNNSNSTISTTGNITAGNISITGGSLTWSNASIVQTSASDVSITGDGQVTVRSLDGTYQWTFGTDGNLAVPGSIIGAATIDIDNRDSGNGADIQLYSADDILLQARDRSAGSTSEGGDINIFAGDSAEDSDSSGGDIVIEAGRGGASNIDFGGVGGFVRVEAGQGGNAIGANFSAQSGGDLTLRAGDAGTNNGNIDLGNSGGDVIINAGDSTGNGDPGGTIYLTSGAADASALAGSVVIQAGGTWTFDGDGNLNLPMGGVVYETNIPDGALSGSAIALKPTGGTNADQELLIYPTVNDANHLHLTTGNLYNTELFLGDDNLYVKLANTGNVVVNTDDTIGNTAQWTFGTTGNLTLPGNTFAVNYANGTPVSIGGGSANTGNVTFNDQAVVGTGDQVGSSGLYLAPGTESVGNLQYIRVRGGDVATHIHLDTGNNAYFDQYFGDDGKYVKLANTGNVEIGSNDAMGNSASWTFGIDGSLTLPIGVSIDNSVAPQFPRIIADSGKAFSVQGQGNSGSAALAWTVDPNAASQYAAVAVTRGGGANLAKVVLQAQSDSGNVATVKIWRFDETGNLTLPDGMTINGNINTLGSQTALLQPTDDLPLSFVASGANGTVTSFWAEDVANLMSSNIAAVYTPLQNTQTVRIVTGTNGGNIAIYDFDKDGVFSTSQVSATGNVSAAYLVVSGGIRATGASPAPTLSGFSSISTVSASGNITASGNLIANVGITTVGNVTGNYFIGNGSQLTGLSANYSNANVADYLPTYTGNIAGNIVKSGYTWTFSNTGTTTFPTGVTLSNARGPNTVNFLTGVDKSFQIETQTNVTSKLWNFTTDGNLTLPQNGNINFSNGVNILSNLAGTYDNANVATFLAAYGSNTISTTGNITAGNVNTTGNVIAGNILVAGSISPSGVASPAPSLSGFSSVSAINLSASGNITANSFIGNGNQLTGISYTNISNTPPMISPSYELHVAKNGNDTTGNGDVLNPYLTITKAVAVASNSFKIIVHAGEYTENVIINNIDYLTITSVDAGGVGAPTPTILGNLTVSGTSTSTAIKNVGINAIITHSASGSLYLTDLSLGQSTNIGTLNKTGSGYLSIQNCNLGISSGVTLTNVNITGSGTVVFNNTQLAVVTVNNASASVSIVNNSNTLSVTLTTGTLNVFDSYMYTLGNSGFYAVNATGGVLQIRNSILVNPNQTPARVNLASPTVFAYDDIYFDRANSTLGISANATVDFQSIRLSGALSVTGNITGGNILTTGQISATGNITTANSFVGNLIGTTVSITGNVSAGNLSVTGNVTGNYILGNGALLTGIAANYGNANVSNFLANGFGSNTITTTGNVSAGNLVTTGLISATGNVTGGNILTGGLISATGNITGGNLIANVGINTVGNVTAGNIAVTGIVTFADATYQTTAWTGVANTYIALGTGAGGATQSQTAVAIGVNAGNVNQDYYTVAIGIGAGQNTQLAGAIAIGGEAGGNSQGTNSIAIGFRAGRANQANNSIVLNGTGANLNNTTPNTFTVAPVRNDVANVGQVMFYNTTSKEITYGNVISVAGNITAGNLVTGGRVVATGNIVTAGNFVGNGAALSNVTVSVAGNIIGTQSNVTLVAGAYSTVFDNTGNLTLPGNTFSVNYANNTPVDVVTRFENSWTVPVGNSTQSFTVTASNTYYMWVDCNIPNGILVWNATGTVTNTNVPVVGYQYAWVYNGGGTPIDFTSIPNQFIGSANAIVRSNVAPSSTTNRFDFGINNTSGGNVTVRYGWIQIS